MRCIKRGGAAPPAAQAVSHTAWRAWSMPWSHLPLSFAAGPGRSPAGRAQVWSPRTPSTAPCSVKAKVLWSSTPWAKFPDPIGPSSGSTRHPVRCSEVVSWTTRTVLCSKHCWAVSLVRPCGKAAGCTRGLARKRETPLACPQRPAACGMASLGRSANVSQMEAKRAERRLSGNTVPAATRAAQSVCVCIEHPLLGIKVCCQRLLSYYLLSACLVGRSHQLTEVMGNAQAFQRVRVRHFDDLLHQGPPDDIQVEVTYRDLGMILYTSGTTRPSKGVLMPHGHLYLFGLGMKVHMGLTPEDRYYICLPLFHAQGS